VIHAVILAAGHAVRFHGALKQLLPMPDGDTLLSRMIRQVAERGGRSYVATWHPPIVEYCRFSGADVVVPSAYRWTVETMLSTMSVWHRDRTIILLGDVVYSRAVMDEIFHRSLRLGIWGNQAEVFALSFTSQYWVGIELGLRETIRLTEGGAEPGKLRSFYRHTFPTPFWIQVGDYTRDFDLPEHVRDFRREVLQTNRLDDRRASEQ
jgi:hypothetical protein